MNKTKNYYNGIAHGYKELYHKEQIQKIYYIIKELPHSGKILDLGSGDGVLNQFLDSNIELISFDISEELLKLNPNKKKNKIQGDIQNLPFKTNEFDYILSFSVFQDILNKKKAIRETYRVLKPNGKFIISFVCINKETVDTITTEIFKYFKIEKKIKEEKDLIFILNKNIK